MGSTEVVTALVQARWKRNRCPLLRLIFKAAPLLLFASGKPSSLFPFKIGQIVPLALFTPGMAARALRASALAGAAVTKVTAVMRRRF